MRIVRWFALVLVLPLLTAAENPTVKRTESEARLKRDITFLASDQCEGRGPGTNGINKAADYVVEQFKQAGLKPGGVDGSWFQPFTVNSNVLDAPAKLVLTSPQGQVIALDQGEHFWPMALGGSGSDKGALVFAGYGITNDKAEYDDYADVDVAHKIVVLLRGSPPCEDKKRAAELAKGASFSSKVINAQKHDAAAVLVVNDVETARDGDDLLDFQYTAFGRSTGKIPVCHVRRGVVEMMTGGADTLATFEKNIVGQRKPRSRELTGWKCEVEVRQHRGTLDVKNVLGVLEGEGPLANETIVVGAHYDHLGYGGNSSLAGLKKMAIHHGADDNGSGTTTMMELARRFASMPNHRGRRLVFMAFSGEELGLFGSQYYCKHPLFPLDKTAAMLNLDMVGRLRIDKDSGKAKILTEGSGTAKPFLPLLDKLAEKYDFKMVNKPSGFGPSDHASFCGKDVPVLFVWTNYHEDYHRHTDTADKINVEGMRRIADLAQDIVMTFTTMDKPAFVKVKSESTSAGEYRGPTLGIRPEYSDEGEGVLIGGVADGRPAAKAGLRADDRILSIDGKPIKNIQTYMTVMGGFKAGQALEVGILRKGKKMTVKVTLE